MPALKNHEEKMYWLTVIIRAFKLNDVYEHMIEQGIKGMTVTEVRGFGSHKSIPETYRGNTYTIPFVPKVKIELAVAAEDLERVIEGIIDSAKTGSPGDGKIFVSKLEQAVRIRTNEVDLDAI